MIELKLEDEEVFEVYNLCSIHQNNCIREAKIEEDNLKQSIFGTKANAQAPFFNPHI